MAQRCTADINIKQNANLFGDPKKILPFNGTTVLEVSFTTCHDKIDFNFTKHYKTIFCGGCGTDLPLPFQTAFPHAEAANTFCMRCKAVSGQELLMGTRKKTLR